MPTMTKLTVDDLDQMDLSNGRYELIDGELVEMSPAGRIHGRIGGKVLGRVLSHVESLQLGEVYNADTGFALTSERTRCADVAFVSAPRLVGLPDPMKILRIAPDLVVEIVSPTDRPGSVDKKITEWLAAGVRLLWLFDPDTRSITVYAAGEPARTLGPDRTLGGGEVLPGFRARVADFFA